MDNQQPMSVVTNEIDMYVEILEAADIMITKLEHSKCDGPVVAYVKKGTSVYTMTIEKNTDNEVWINSEGKAFTKENTNGANRL